VGVSRPLLVKLASGALVGVGLLTAVALSAAPAGASSSATARRSVPLVPSAALAHPASVGRKASTGSLNWAGYVKSGSKLSSTSATFHVPTLLTTYNGYSAAWVGLDGATDSDNYLIQTGVEADVVNHRTSYYAWWEVITPSNVSPEVPFTLAVRPGDSISASVVKGASGHWTMTVKNNTTKKAAAHTSSFGGTGRSAEWIMEDTDVNGFVSTAPDWQKISFTSIRVNGSAPKLTSSQALDIVSAPPLLGLLGPGKRETLTSAPNSTKDGFTVTWLATGTRSHIG
jgi:predicted RecA/RadA family phage recombinase